MEARLWYILFHSHRMWPSFLFISHDWDTTENSRMRISRVGYTINGTFGVLLDANDYPVCVTLENPWKDNQPSVSCIPAGSYEAMPVNSPKFGPTWEVIDVEGRTHILFHKGNTHLDTHGCILVGSRYGQLSGIPAVLESNTAFVHLMAEWAELTIFPLDIVDVDGVPF